MKMKTVLFALCAVLLAPCAHAQWQTTTYTLKGGWNAIYLSGDATYNTIDNILPNSGATANITNVWRWNPNPTQVQFMDSPLIPSEGTPEWSRWERGGTGNTMTTLVGPGAFLVKCSGTTANTYTVQIKQAPKPPGNSWVRNGANLLGFPSFKNGVNYPTFSSYFATFPAAIAANTKIFKYIGGELGAGNPLQIFSPTAERLDRTQAYWFSAEVAGEFYAPVEISLSNKDGLVFGRTGAAVTARIRNRTSAPMTLTLTPMASESAPASKPQITGNVPLTRRTFNTSTLLWTEDLITLANNTVAIGPQTTVELNFGIRRADLAAGGVDAFYASFLKLTDSGNLTEILMPSTAEKASLAGLWVGDVSVTNVSNKVTNPAKATATVKDGVIKEIKVTGSGGYGYDSAPVVTIAAPALGVTATATAIVAAGSVTGFTITNAGSGYAVASPKVTIANPPPLTGTTTPRAFPLRTLLHVADDGTAKLLSKVFVGQLATGGMGLCTLESLLKQDAKASAQRLVAAHLPLNQVLSGGSGSVAVPGTLTRIITVGYNEDTNPFVHRFHPDHDNKTARFDDDPLLSAGVESYTITRTCTFTFTTTPPSGSSVTSGWGSEVIGGTYHEIMNGLHKQPLQIDGTFELRRASEIGTLTQ